MNKSVIADIVSTCSAIEQTVISTFGPNGRSVLLLSHAGTALITRVGVDILKSLVLGHPVAKLLVDAAQRHVQIFGDGSISFILMVAAGLRDVCVQQ